MQTFSILSLLPSSSAPWPRRLRDAVRKASEIGETCAECCRQGYAASRSYDELGGLSADELRRRGIPDGDLPRYLGKRLGTR